MNKIKPIEVLKWLLAAVLAIGFAILGSVCNAEGLANPIACGVALGVFSLGLITGTVISLVKKKKFVDGVDRENLQSQLLAERERGSEIAEEKLRLLKKLIRTIDFCSVVILFGVCIIDFCFFALVGVQGSGVALPMIIGMYTGLGFIRYRHVETNENKSENYLLEVNFPEIYATAKRAADKIGCEGKIKIFVDHDFNAGISVISDGYSIRLGSFLLDNTSQEELYNVLLHEFAHVTKENADINRVMSYAGVSQDSGDAGGFAVFPYIYFHAKFMFEFFSYRYICSLMYEDAADRAMRDHGDPRIAASMLIKLKFFELYQWEMNTYDVENLFEPETLIEDPVRKPLRMFRERYEIRQNEWIKMIDSEIISRAATHPTVKMRIESLGISEAKIMPRNDSEEFLCEVDKAISRLEDMMIKELTRVYSQLREQNYLAPKRLIDEWEKEGKPITKENYQNIIVALFTIDRITDFVNLCCQVIEKIPEPANYFAHHMYGCYLLHSYDERGIEHLYKSVELNHNNWEEAMHTIGEYACTVGKQDQLDKYRERASELMEKEVNVYEKMNSLKSKDKIVEEHLPGEMLEDFIRYIEVIDNGTIDKIYMVRKIISDEHFVTCVIVEPKKKAELEKLGDAMDKIFQYLDKSSDWQYSLYDVRALSGVRFKQVKNSCIYDSRAKK